MSKIHFNVKEMVIIFISAYVSATININIPMKKILNSLGM